MLIKNAKFICSSADVRDCPVTELPEYAFTGRSNVGKSSLINYLTNRKKLAHTSSTPGKTQLINHFLINDDWYLVDLPGYGFVKTGRTKKSELTQIISDYVLKRERLACLFVLLDSGLEPQKIDVQFITWLGMNEIPFVLTLTKTDKISVSQFDQNKKKYESLLLQSWVSLPRIFKTSVLKKTGRDEILEFIEHTNQELENMR